MVLSRTIYCSNEKFSVTFNLYPQVLLHLVHTNIEDICPSFKPKYSVYDQILNQVSHDIFPFQCCERNFY